MKIAYIVPGTGGTFYCENCVRDIALIKALMERHHEIIVVPMYLPLSSDEPGVRGDTEVFFGAIGTYLRQKYQFMRIFPRWLMRTFDSPGMLNWAAKKASTVRATGLEEMTLSILIGEQGPHVAEVDRLVKWLEDEEKPDIVHLSDALLLGLVRRLKEKLHVPIVCSLQDEDTWIDAMQDPLKSAIWKTLADRAAEVDAFVAVSRSFAASMTERMHLPPEKVQVVPIGIEPEIFHQAPLSFRPPVIGFVARMSESLGLGVLIEAFIRLKADSRFRNLRLRITGGQTGDDVQFIENIHSRLRELRLQEDVDFILDFDRKRRLDFLQTLSVFSVPSPSGAAFGLSALEAIASGVPVVQPDVGAFRELIETTEGGVLFDSGDIDQYTDALKSLLLDPERSRQIGRQGRDAALQRYSVSRMAVGMISVYESAVRDKR
jgi:glycosyltransferase involved in cell wall biosynthesis